MSGNNIIKRCFFCNRTNLGQFKKVLPSTNVTICQTCCKQLTIGEFISALKYKSLELQQITINEILNDNSMDIAAAD